MTLQRCSVQARQTRYPLGWDQVDRVTGATAASLRLAMTERLERTEQKLVAVLEYLDAALSLLQDPGELYQRASDEHRRMLNQALFARIYVVADEVIGAEFNEPFEVLLAADDLYAPQIRGENKNAVPENRNGVESSNAAALVNIAWAMFRVTLMWWARWGSNPRPAD